MNPTIIKRSIVLNRHKTSVSLEKEFWDGLREIAAVQGAQITRLVSQIDQDRRAGANLSSAIRVFVFNHLCAQIVAAQVSHQIVTEWPIKGRQPSVTA
jgi:predicted DNA-binding ribbon-helix-helix protein